MTLSKKAVRDLSTNPIPNYYWEHDIKASVKELKTRWPKEGNKELHKDIKQIFGAELTGGESI